MGKYVEWHRDSVTVYYDRIRFAVLRAVARLLGIKLTGVVRKTDQ
jgi:hypothetical protein